MNHKFNIDIRTINIGIEWDLEKYNEADQRSKAYAPRIDEVFKKWAEELQVKLREIDPTIYAESN